MVANISTSRYLGFNKPELTAEGHNHNKALHIFVTCAYTLISRVLVNIGYSLNVLPKSKLSQLQYDGTKMRSSALIVRTFDGSQREVIGEVDFPIYMGPHQFFITFQFMDNYLAYSFLLGRPWIHAFSVVTSTQHEEGIVEVPFQGLDFEEVISASTNQSHSTTLVLSSSKSSKKTLENGPLPGWGQIVRVYEKHDHFGLDYRPTSRHPATRGGKRFNPVKFNSVGYEWDYSVAVVDRASSSQYAVFGLIRKCPLVLKLDKLTSTMVLVVFSEEM